MVPRGMRGRMMKLRRVEDDGSVTERDIEAIDLTNGDITFRVDAGTWSPVTKSRTSCGWRDENDATCLCGPADRSTRHAGQPRPHRSEVHGCATARRIAPTDADARHSSRPAPANLRC
jgi:hypothetical protein